jgi:hypothetical protein
MDVTQEIEEALSSLICGIQSQKRKGSEQISLCRVFQQARSIRDPERPCYQNDSKWTSPSLN